MKRIKYRVSSLLILFMLISGCAQTNTEAITSTTEPTSLPPTVTPSPIPSITPSPTLQHEGIILTAVASEIERRAASFNYSCTPPSYENPPIDIPEPDKFSWQKSISSIGELRQLNGLTTPILYLDPSPHGRWVIMSLLYQDYGYGASGDFLYMIDTVENRHWVIRKEGSGDNTYRWLPDGRIVWVDDGKLFVANVDGSNRRDLNAPASVYELWIGANDIALVSGEEYLWRFSLNDETWEKVSNITGVAIPSANLNISIDGTFAAVNIQGEISIVPLQMGTSAQTFVRVDYPGRDGRIRAPEPVPNTPYWFISEVIPSGQEETQSMLLDTRDGSLHSLDKFFPEGIHRISDISPDGQWIYAWSFKSALEIDNVPISDIYVAPTSDFKKGSIVFTGVFSSTDVIGWESNPPAMLISPYTGSQDIIRISLDNFKSEVVPASLPFESWKNGTKFIIDEMTTNTAKSFQVKAFSQENEILGILDLPLNTTRAEIYPIGETDTLIVTRELINQVGYICYYDYHLWQWKVIH